MWYPIRRIHRVFSGDVRHTTISIGRIYLGIASAFFFGAAGGFWVARADPDFALWKFAAGVFVGATITVISLCTIDNRHRPRATNNDYQKGSSRSRRANPQPTPSNENLTFDHDQRPDFKLIYGYLGHPSNPPYDYTKDT